MSFFGQQNNQQQGTGFGGFGSNKNTTAGGFGQQPATSGGGLFGGTANTTGGGFGGFGSGGTSGGFGSAGSTTTFGQNRPGGFGATTSTAGGGLFGSGTATAGTSGGFGGFGGTNNNNNASGGGLFGSTPKPAFGASNTGGGGLFGGGSTGGGFGSMNNQTTSAFGQPNSTALGGNVGECQGTGSTPFTAWTEKENGTGNMTNHFQSISFMGPYKNFSFEELRLADYNQGRRYGNANGQAGAFGSTNFGAGFGQTSGTGGFGQSTNSGGGLFGSAATSAPFGQSQPATTGGFGSGGGLFGSQKPATGGLFGSTNTASSAPAGGSLFGTSAGNTGGFGSGGGGFGGGGGLFGSNNNTQNQQSKPLAFGATTSTAGTGGFGSGTGFGTTNNTSTGGGLFGSAQTTNNSNPFGGQQQQQQTQSSNPFGGGFGAQNTTTTGFGASNNTNTTGGLFGSAQPAANTGGGLFGNQSNNQQPASGGLFGNTNNNNQQPGGLFGAKPAATGGGLFGNTGTNSNTGGGLFGGGFGNTTNQAQQNPGNSLFSNANNQQKPGGLFGNAGGNTGNSLFGNANNNNNQQAGGLFGSQNQQPQQQQTSSLFGNTNNNQGSSLFGNSQQQPTQPNAFQQPQTFQTSILDPNAFGSPSIFGGLPPPPQVNGPIATPISARKQMKKSAVVPNYKLTPNGPPRYQTPQRRGGFGFSYSTYGTPGSASSNVSTPGGFNSSLYSSVGRGLGKSLSTSNLRRNFDDADSILTPGAFSAGSSRYGGSSNMKRLTIDRSLRTDLFSGAKDTPPALPSPEKERQPSILKKKVSFDASTVGGNGEQQGAPNGSIENEQSNQPTAEQQGFLRSPRPSVRAKTSAIAPQPEMDQVRGNELAIVHEDALPEAPVINGNLPAAPRTQEDQKPGQYWMKPSKEDLLKLPKDQRTRVQGFSVGREGCGFVEFDMPVDLTLTKNLDDIYGNIVHIELRSITVYPDQNKKPALGKGLNVPSTLHLENSWPRQKDKKTPLYESSGPRFQKHVDRLRKVGGTEFVRYEKDTGTWVFKVPHFTTYGFDYEDDASVVSEGDNLQSSMLSEAPPTPTPRARGSKREHMQITNGSTEYSETTIPSQPTDKTPAQDTHIDSSVDDTFQFRKKKILPGSFEEDTIADREEEASDHEMVEAAHHHQSFLGERLVSPSDSDEDEPSEENAVNQVEDQSLVVRGSGSEEDDDDVMELEMAGAFPQELEAAKSMLTPSEAAFTVSGDWAADLQRTISPKKQDRQALRETQVLFREDHGYGEEQTPTTKRVSAFGKDSTMATHMDLMDSLWGQEQLRRQGRKHEQTPKAKSVKLPYSKMPGADEDGTNMPEQIRLLHDNYKPRWGPESLLMYSIPGKVGKDMSTHTDEIIRPLKTVIVSEGRDIRFAKVGASSDLVGESLHLQRANTKITVDSGVPMAQTQHTPFADFAAAIDPASAYEKAVWQLASILFDDQDSIAHGVPASQAAAYDYRIRKDRLIEFWSQLCSPAAIQAAKGADSQEERALQYLSAYQVVDACEALIEGKDYHLATLISQIGDGDKVTRDDMQSQINTWRDLNSVSEMTEPVRALYALTAGKTSRVEGKKGPPEDRAATFAMSTRFSLDWKRAFGLRLFYAVLSTEPIEVAIKSFAEDLQSGAEPAKPSRMIAGSNENREGAQGQDLLWGLLQLYAASKDWLPLPSLAHMLTRQWTSENDSVNTRLSFQLYHALVLHFPNAVDDFVADSLAIDFSQQLECVGEWMWSLFATLHITSPAQRQRAIQALLSFHVDEFDADSDDQRFRALVQDCKVPKAWIWRAKALAARTVTQNHVEEATFLIKADDLEAAHKVLRRIVGPHCVIAEEWVVLGDLLASFQKSKESISDWGLGGQVYEDYLTLIQNRVSGNEKVTVLGRLMETLPNLAKQSNDSQGRKGTRSENTRLKREGFEETVALREIGATVAKEVMTMGDGPWKKEAEMQRARVLQLPLAKEQYVRGTMELAERYYRGVLAGN